MYMKEHFDIKTGPADFFIGLLIERDRQNRCLHVSQPSYVKRMLSKFNMLDCNPRSTPADSNAHLTAEMSPSDTHNRDLPPYREAVGTLMYCMLATRPDISFDVGRSAQFNNNPGKAHWEAVKRIMSYLKETADFGIRFVGGTNDGTLRAFSDADYAGDVDTRRSTTGYILLLNNGPIGWTSRRQQCTTLSTTEAEYVAACEATKEIVWMRNLLNHIGLPQPEPTTLLCDNQSAIRLVKNPEFHRRTKHKYVQFHFIREK